MNKKSHAEEEKKLSSTEERFIDFLMKSGYLADPKIEDLKTRRSRQENNKQTYHNTRMLLENYRDLMWAMESVPAELRAELDVPMTELDALISRLDLEMSMGNRRVESRLQTIVKSRMLLERLNEAIAFIKTKPTDGEQLYQVIYQTYIGEKKESVFDVMSELGLSKGKYYDMRQRAITLVGMKLWAAPDANFELWMELLSMLAEM